MTSSRPSAFSRFCAAVVGRRAAAAAAGGVRGADHDQHLAEIPLQGVESRQAEHHVHARRFGQHGLGVSSAGPSADGVSSRQTSRLLPRQRIQCGGDTAPPVRAVRGIQAQDSRSADPQQRFQHALLRPGGDLQSGQAMRTAPTFPAKAATDVHGTLDRASTRTDSPVTRAPTRAESPSNSRPPVIPDTRRGATRQRPWPADTLCRSADRRRFRRDGSMCRRNGRAYRLRRYGARSRRPRSPRATTIRTTVGDLRRGCANECNVRLSHSVTAYGNPYYYTISKVQFCSAKDAAGWGTAPCASRLGPDDLQVRPLRHRRRPRVRPAGIHARRHHADRAFLVNGVAAANPSGRTLCAGDGQFRQVVCVLPDPDAGDEDRGRHRVFGAERGERARRLPHAVGKRRRFSQRQAFRRDP